MWGRGAINFIGEESAQNEDNRVRKGDSRGLVAPKSQLIGVNEGYLVISGQERGIQEAWKRPKVNWMGQM